MTKLPLVLVLSTFLGLAFPALLLLWRRSPSLVGALGGTPSTDDDDNAAAVAAVAAVSAWTVSVFEESSTVRMVRTRSATTPPAAATVAPRRSTWADSSPLRPVLWTSFEDVSSSVQSERRLSMDSSRANTSASTSTGPPPVDEPPRTVTAAPEASASAVPTEPCSESCCTRCVPPSPSPPPPPFISRTVQEETQPAAAAATATACPLCETCHESSSSSGGNPLAFLPASVQYSLIFVLISASAIFSGLTLGVMGLDKTGLEIVMDSDDATNAGYARRIYPVRKNGNLLLCSLLWGNTAANTLLSILVADKFGGLVGVAISTILVLLFGEIIPQAVCNRYALYIGSRAVPLVVCIMFLFYPIAKPLAFILDLALGEELATTYSSKEMLKLLQIHVDENAMDHETAHAMTGALQYRHIKVADVMTPLDNVFMLKSDETLNFEAIARIFKTGYSRVPVYEVHKNNVVGLLFVKDLIFIDPADATRVSDFIDIFGRGVHVVWPDDTLGDVLRELKNGRSHMALVRDVNRQDDNQDPFYEVRGIITLEDIIEEILGQEIVDETDAFLDGTHLVKLDRTDAWKFASMRLLDSKMVEERLTIDETRAVTAHLMKNYESVVSLLTEKQIHILIAETPVSELPTATEEIGQNLPSDLLYTKGLLADFCTLILAGKVTVLVGVDEFRSDVSSWSLLAAGALDDPSYTPDFSAFVSSGPCRCIRLTRSRFAAAVDASALERTQSPSSSLSIEGAATPSPDPAIDTEATRKSMFMSALRIVDTTSHQKDSSSRSTKLGARTVSFADSQTLRRGVSTQRIGNIRATSLLSSRSQAVVSSQQPSQFDFISSPDPSEKSEVGDET